MDVVASNQLIALLHVALMSSDVIWLRSPEMLKPKITGLAAEEPEPEPEPELEPEPEPEPEPETGARLVWSEFVTPDRRLLSNCNGLFSRSTRCTPKVQNEKYVGNTW